VKLLALVFIPSSLYFSGLKAVISFVFNPVGVFLRVNPRALNASVTLFTAFSTSGFSLKKLLNKVFEM
jgi:hypothetical protein